MHTVHVATWNIERRAPDTRQAKILLDRIQALAPDIVCLTEAFEGSTSCLGGFEISVRGVSWASEVAAERKVVLWSKQPWDDIDMEGNDDLRSGAFLSATTATPIGRIRISGLCMPHGFASPTGMVPKLRPWSEHLRFLAGLQPLLANRDRKIPTIALGDFNQFWPRIWGPKAATAALGHALCDLQICTNGLIEGVGRPAIDHIAASPDLVAVSTRGIDEHDADGRKLSDHFGVSATFER
jgi:endonuclease/exonuclease/phosphatase family metal-dependent hydrolase